MSLGFSGWQLPHVSMPGPNASAAQLVNSFNDSQAQSTAVNQDLANRAFAAIDRNVNELKQGSANNWKWLRMGMKAGRRAIDRNYSKEVGDMMNNLVSSGLGNSTIQGSMKTGLMLGHEDALANHRAAWSEKMFNAKRNTGLDIANLQQHGIDSILQNVKVGYPDAGAYAAMIAASAAGAGMGGAGGGMGGGTVMFDPSRPVGGPRPAWTYASPQVAFEGGGGGGYDSLADQSNYAAAAAARGAQDQANSAAALYASNAFQAPDYSAMNFARGAWDNG